MSKASLDEIRIMLVESHRPTKRVLESATSALRIQAPLWYEDPVEAFESIKADTPDLLIVGQGLSEFDSLNLVEWIREDPEQPYAYLPIIFLSPEGSPLASEAIAKGVHTVLARPISPDSLQTTISGLLERPPPFIKAGSYFGPDRRLQNLPHDGPDRRRVLVRRVADS